MPGPETRATGKGLSLVDLLAGAAVLFYAYRIAARYTTGWARSLSVWGQVWLGWIVASLGPRRILQIAAQADPLLLGLSILPIVGRFLIWGVKWTLMLRRNGPIGFRITFRALLAGVFVNLTTPTAKLAGGFVRAALIHRRTGWGMATAYGWSFADQVTNLLGNLVRKTVIEIIEHLFDQFLVGQL